MAKDDVNSAVERYISSGRSEKDVERKEHYFKMALQIQPKNIRALNNMGLLLQQKGEFREAISYYEIILDLGVVTKPSPIYYNIAVCLKRLGNLEGAKTYINRALAKKPDEEIFLELKEEILDLLNGTPSAVLPHTTPKASDIGAPYGEWDPPAIAVDGTYDDANRLASEVADQNPDWAFVNINIRPYYTEGSRTLAFETAEQLGWNAPDHIVAPLGSGALLCALTRGYSELENIGLIDSGKNVRISGSQPTGCSPISTAVQNDAEVIPIRELDTIAHSLAIGNPADGYYAKQAIQNSNGYAASVTNEEILDAILLLARTEGIFTEPAGGTTVAGLKNLVESGHIDPEERTVVYVTGNGLKAQETIAGALDSPGSIKPTYSEFTNTFRNITKEQAPTCQEVN